MKNYRLLLMLLTILLLFVNISGAATLSSALPAAASPGGALPELEDDRKIPSRPIPGTVRFRYQSPSNHISSPADENVPRMYIRHFNLVGVVDRPELGIVVSDIEALIASEQKKRENRFSIDDLRILTNRLNLYYHQRGFFLARAFIPEQTVGEEVVTINILEGLLENVSAEGGGLYTNPLFARPFNDLINKPLRILPLERALLQLSEYPGVKTSASFMPAKGLGSATLTLAVIDEHRYVSGLWFDNYGTDITGKYRLRYAGQVNNLSGSADHLNFTILQTLNPMSSFYYAFAYQRPLFFWDSYFGMDYNKNGFDIGGDLTELNITGDSTVIDFYFRKVIIRKRQMLVESTLSLALKNAVSTQEATNIGEDTLTVLSPALAFQSTDDWLGGSHAGLISVSIGLESMLGAMDSNGNGASSRTGNAGGRAGGGFTTVNISYSHWFPFKKNQSVKVHYRGQYSNDLLTSMEQIPLGGFNSVRAYPASEALMDSASIFSLEWLAEASHQPTMSWMQDVQFKAYFDYASGTRNSPLTNEVADINLKGFGGGISMNAWRQYELAFNIGIPIGAYKATNGDSFQPFFSLGHTF